MGGRGALIGVLAVAAITAAPAGAAAACARDGEVTIAKNRSARVVATPSGGYFRGFYGCLGASDRRVEIESENGPDVERLKLSGTFVAYIYSDQLGEEYGRGIVVRDLRVEESPEPGTAPGYEVEQGDVSVDFPQSPEGPFVRRFGLRPDGAIAYTVWHEGRWSVRGWAPYMRDPVVLDRGPGVDPGSLKLRRRTARWHRRGIQRSSPLPKPER